MPFELPRIASVALVALILGGCVTTQSETIQPAAVGADQPRESKQDRRLEAARVHTELGQRYMQRGQLEIALEKLETALKFDPKYPPANTVIAVLYERIGKLELAERYYRQAQKLEPSKGGPNNNLGQFLCKTGRIDESVRYLNQALADPFYQTPGAAWLNLGSCQLKAGRGAEAEAALRQALALEPDNPEALYLMAGALHAKQDDFRARAFIQRFEALGHPNPDALLLAWRIETALGEGNAARQYAKRLRDEFPDSEQARSLSSQATP